MSGWRRAGHVNRLIRLTAAVALAPMAAWMLPASSQAGAAGPAFTKTKTISRVHLEGGKDVVADRRKFTVSVDQTTGLQDRQEIRVRWSGAHPTGYGVADPNSPEASLQEYPVVILECRGVDSASAPKSEQISPQTCWTQTAQERYFDSPQTLYPAWRMDRYATPANRAKVVGAPTTWPSTCFPNSDAQAWLPFRALDGTVYDGGLFGCAGLAPEESVVGSTLGLPGNATYGATQADGTGAAKFDVWTSLTNASLGCGPTVRCSLEVIPIEGISCDVAATGLPSQDRPPADEADQVQKNCESPGGQTDIAVTDTGELWWSASNWRNRINVPLQFAALPTQCDKTGAGKKSVDVYGSELMTEASLQWGIALCANPHLPAVTHVQTAEPQARNLLETGNTNAAYTVDGPPGGYPTPVVSAPVAMTGFAITYAIDNANGREVTNLRLTPRLLAKLLTESYPGANAIKEKDTALAGNPINVAADPEFQALNPGIPHDVSARLSASTMVMLSSDSDVTHALTAYINADPEARAWLDGQPDPWGMTVNPSYKGILLPVDNWPLLDTYVPHDMYDNGLNPCLEANPVPYLPLVASPQSRLATITLDMQFAIAPSQVICQLPPDGNKDGAKLVALGRQSIGSRFLIGITSLAEADRYGLDIASLQTRVGRSAPADMTDVSGRAFVAPTHSSLVAAARLLQPDRTAGVWQLPYQRLVGPTGSATAYPGALLVSAAVPTTGLPSDQASAYASYLTWAATQGQTPGTSAGQLPVGYLPMTAANGLGAQARYTQIAAEYVAARNGKVPDLTHPVPLSPPKQPPAGGSANGTGGVPGPNGGGGHVLPPPATPTGGSVPGAGGGSRTPTGTPPAKSPAVASPSQPTALSAVTAAIKAGFAGGLLPLLAVIAGLAGCAALLTGYRIGPRRR